MRHAFYITLIAIACLLAFDFLLVLFLYYVSPIIGRWCTKRRAQRDWDAYKMRSHATPPKSVRVAGTAGVSPVLESDGEMIVINGGLSSAGSRAAQRVDDEDAAAACD